MKPVFGSTSRGVDVGKIINNSGAFASEDSANLSRTFSAGNQKIWTLSFWTKRSTLGSTVHLFESNSAVSTYPQATLQFLSDNTLRFFSYNGSSYDALLVTDAVFRDTSAWYHFVVEVDTTQGTSTNRVKLYCNGEQLTISGSPTYPGSSVDLYINAAKQHTVGSGWRASTSGNAFYDGYLTEVYFTDGTAYTADDFGYTNEIGVWVPKSPSVTYGTNGFYLPFTGTMGHDESGNSNDFTNNNVVASTDTPTYNHAILNSLKTPSGNTLESAALSVDTSAANRPIVPCGIAMSSGSWYCEVTVNSNALYAGVVKTSATATEDAYTGSNSFGYYYTTTPDSQKKTAASTLTSLTGTPPTAPFTLGLAFDADAGTLEFYEDNTSVGSITGLTNDEWYFCAGDLSGSVGSTVPFTFAESDFTYTPPSGFQALQSANLPEPEINDGSKFFNTVLYTGNATTDRLIECGFQPDLVWAKRRDAVSNNELYDSVRGATKYLLSDSVIAEGTAAEGLKSFVSNGFTVGDSTGSSMNVSGSNTVAWCFKKRAGFFDIVDYPGDGNTSQLINHNLGVAPEFMIVKSRTATLSPNWSGYHISLGNTKNIQLNTTASAGTGTNFWNDTTPTNTQFTVGNADSVNDETDDYIAYLFASVEGFCKIGSYTGNADGMFVWTGFRPAFLLVKRTDVANYWLMLDSSRDDHNPTLQSLYANSSEVENQFGTLAGIDFLSNGFKVRDSSAGANASGGTYIYMAIAENPQKYARAR